jgi:hypothetical protein
LSRHLSCVAHGLELQVIEIGILGIIHGFLKIDDNLLPMGDEETERLWGKMRRIGDGNIYL